MLQLSPPPPDFQQEEEDLIIYEKLSKPQEAYVLSFKVVSEL